MLVVTAEMRAVRQARRAAERALRGAPPRTRFGPRPAGLIASGWTPAPAAEPRLLGVDAPAVVIADRACYATASRRVEGTALPLLPVVTGPMPANPLAAFSVTFAAAAVADGTAAAAEAAPVVEPLVGPVGDVAAEPVGDVAAESAGDVAAEPVGDVAAESVGDLAAEVAVAPAVEVPAPPPPAAPEADLPPGPWTIAAPPSLEPPAPASAPPAPVPETAPAPSPEPAPTPASGVEGPSAVPVGVAAAALAPPAPSPARPASPTVPTPPSGHTSPVEPLPSDLFAHALGLSPANTPAPPPVELPRETRAMRRRSNRSPYDQPRRGRLWLAAAAVVVVAGGGTAVGLAVTGGSSSPSPTTTASSANAALTDKVSTWLAANVPADHRIVATDAALASALNAAGVPVDPVASVDDQRAGAVVVHSDAGAVPPLVLPVGSDRSLVDLAVFGSGAATVAVGQVVDGAEADVSAALDAVKGKAATACHGLATDEHILAAATVGPLLAAGGLDLRAATFLAQLADKQVVRVVAAPQDPAEKAAQSPVRTLVLKVDDAAALKQAAATAKEPYVPEVDAPGSGVDAPDGSLVLSWPVDPAATLTVK